MSPADLGCVLRFSKLRSCVIWRSLYQGVISRWVVDDVYPMECDFGEEA